LIEKAAPTDSTILITGESGTGKELIARAIHARSPYAKHEFVAVNCGAIPETLIESELFGHVRGAFTGAVSDRHGLFRQAHHGTIFLDEIGELPLPMQVRLLRVLQDRQVVPVGGSHPFNVDVRVVAATNRDIERLVQQGGFREDLYYRLNVIRIATPPLRDRPEDVPLLLLHMLQRCSERHGKAVEKVSPRTMRALVSYPYPGNIRELENIVDHAVTLCDGDTLTEHDLPAHVAARHETAPVTAEPDVTAAPTPLLADGRSLDDQLAAYEKEMLMTALDRAGGVRKRAAELLGIKYRSLRHRLSKYGLGDDDDLDVGQALEG
jgi:two-component system response regulator PilR (NtrC family)